MRSQLRHNFPIRSTRNFLAWELQTVCPPIAVQPLTSRRRTGEEGGITASLYLVFKVRQYQAFNLAPQYATRDFELACGLVGSVTCHIAAEIARR